MGAIGGAQVQRHHARRFQPGLAETLGQGQQAQTGPVAVLGVFAGFQQPLDQGCGGHTDAVAPVDQTLWRPLQMRPVGGRQVLIHRGESALVRATQVRRHALAPVQQPYRASRDTGFQRLAHQGLGHAVAVAFKLDVLVNVNPHRLVDRYSQVCAGTRLA